MKINQLQRKIMRRVYRVFAIRVVQHPVTIKIGLFVLALLVFAKLVFVSRVIDNLLGTPILELPRHTASLFFQAAMRGEVLTLLAIGVMVFVALSLPWNVVQIFKPTKIGLRATT